MATGSGQYKTGAASIIQTMVETVMSVIMIHNSAFTVEQVCTSIHYT